MEVTSQHVVSVAGFSLPGVPIGGRLGPKLDAVLNPDALKVGLALHSRGQLFMLVTLMM
jgi:hypothetical protein